MKKKIAIIGAGPGGLTSAMILAHRGFDVNVYEKDNIVGGRNQPIKMNGFTFDTGPTFLMMKYILDEVFQETNRKSSDYLKFKKLDPMYRLIFKNKEIKMTSDHNKMKSEIERVFPGESEGFEKFLKTEQKRFDYLYPCLQKPYSSKFDMLKNPLLKAIPHLDLDKSVHQALSKCFNDELLKLCFTFQSKYLGMSAWECPAAFSMIAYIEHKWGIYHTIGGLNAISLAMAKVVEEEGGKIHLNTKVKKVLNENKKVVGIELENGEKINADYVIVNADFSYAVTNLMDKKYVNKYIPQKLSKKKYSCSIFMLYLGIDKIYDIPHHNVFFAEKYKQNVDDIFKNFKLSDEISFYIQNASITDSTVAPKGKSTIYVLVPVPNLKGDINWEKEKDKFKEKVLCEIENRTELKDIRKHIEVEKVYTPDTWSEQLNVYYGATFNLGHNLSQMLYFRPRNIFECFDNMYLVGGGTHPGSGLPTIYESGKIAANCITKKN